MSIRVQSLAMFLMVCTGLISAGSAQQVIVDNESYLEPPQTILQQVTSPWHTNLRVSNMSPDGAKYLETVDDGLVSLERMAEPYVILGELAIEPGPHRSRSTSTRSDAGYRVHHYVDGNVVDVQVPEGMRVSGAQWSPDGSSIAFLGHAADGTYLCMADATSGEVSQICDRPLLATLVTTFQWSIDGRKISVVLRPESAVKPEPSAVATEPKVRVTRNGERPARTYRFLLETPADMALLEYLITGQLAVVDVQDGTVTNVGEPQMYTSNDMNPKGDFFRASTIQKPFSYFVPTSQFGNKQDLYDIDGNILHNFSERKLGQRFQGSRGGRPGASDSGSNGVGDDKRDVRWRPDGMGLSFLQMEPKPEDEEDADDSSDDSDDGDDEQDEEADEEGEEEKEEPKRKDRVMLWVAPFGEEDVQTVYETEDTIRQIQYSEDCRTIFLTQTIDDLRTITAVNLDEPAETYIVFQEIKDAENGNGAGASDNAGRGARGAGQRGGQRGGGNRGGGRRGSPGNADNSDAADDDASDDPDGDSAADEPKRRGASEGALMTRRTTTGDSVVRISSEGAVYFSGTKSDDLPEDVLPKPYLDKVDIKTGEVTRLYEADGKMLESMSAVANDEMKHIVVTREMRDVVQDSYLIELESKEEKKLTENQNFTPWYTELEVIRFQVERVDGFKFWVRAYRSKEFGMKLPAMFWFYPREVDSQEAYDRSAERFSSPASLNRFGQPSSRSMTHLTQIGYVVVEPDCPIVGESGEWNDNYIPDLRNNLWAVIDAMDKKGWIDRDRLGIGGHSYGAFGTANAMAHTPFFKAGIAGDGNYNRTLTPMSFQREPRSLWNAREVYTRMSPLFWTDQINGALLMYHGIDDANVGTWPINSERMFQALDGTGKPASLYMYPYEAHGPIGRETVLDMWARWVEWLDIYVKHPERGQALAEEKEEESDDDDEQWLNDEELRQPSRDDSTGDPQQDLLYGYGR